MTDEQILQNAEEYYQKLDSITIEDPREPNVNSIIDAYTAGAHSRDEEIEHYRRIATVYKIDAQDTAAECERLHDIIDKLRNPWISVDDRLPEKWKRIKVNSGTGEACWAWVSKTVFVNADGWDNDPEKAFYDFDSKIWWSEFGDNIENLFGAPEYWMYIPDLEKGE